MNPSLSLLIATINDGYYYIEISLPSSRIMRYKITQEKLEMVLTLFRTLHVLSRSEQ